MPDLHYRVELRNRRRFLQPFWLFRVKFKQLLLRLRIQNISFCNDCGQGIRDFIVTDKLWQETVPESKNAVCIHCFVERRAINNFNPVPRLMFDD